MTYENKKVLILGMARSGYEVAKLLIKHNCDITITDKKEDLQKQQELTNLNIKCVITENQADLLDETFDVVIKNPGVPIDNPVILKAKELNILVTNEVEVAYHFFKNVKIIGITGSNGKTTTTTLIYEILKKANLPVHLGGNIGYPVSSLIENIKENDILILELSSHQLWDFKQFKTDIAVITNLSETHIDHFKTYENYLKSKATILNGNPLVITNENNKECLNMTKNSNRILFNSTKKSDIYYDSFIKYKNENIINIEDIKVKGTHNYENIMCAIAVAKQFNIDNEIIYEVLTNFKGVEHRLEYVDTINKINIYNDSKSTNCESTITALKSFDKPTILLLGGLDRNHPFDDLTKYMKNVKCVISYGETKQRIFEYCNKISIPCYIEQNLVNATKKSFEYAKEDDIILLSPACASWDQYDNFEVRGQEFKKTIKEIKNEN